MTIGDGSAWDESNPTNATIATSIDEYDRDLRVGVRSRMAFEHEWPASQASTAAGGKHKFITLQNQAAKPTVSGTQLGAVYTKTSGSGLQELFWENEAGTEVQLTYRSSVGTTSGFSAQLVRAYGKIIVGSTGVLGGFNISSVTRNGSGEYTVVFSTTFANANYTVVPAIDKDQYTAYATNVTSASAQLYIANAAAGGHFDQGTHLQFIALG